MNSFHMNPFGLEIILARISGFPVGANKEPSTNPALDTLRISIGAVGPAGVFFNVDNGRLRPKITERVCGHGLSEVLFKRWLLVADEAHVPGSASSLVNGK